MKRKTYVCSNSKCDYVGREWINAHVPVKVTTSNKKVVSAGRFKMAYRCPRCKSKLIEAHDIFNRIGMESK